jgi:hypothetical protein
VNGMAMPTAIIATDITISSPDECGCLWTKRTPRDASQG